MNFTDASFDNDGTIISWLWDFGDSNTFDIQTPTRKFATAGDYNVTPTVTDDENAVDTYAMNIAVIETPQPK